MYPAFHCLTLKVVLFILEAEKLSTVLQHALKKTLEHRRVSYFSNVDWNFKVIDLLDMLFVFEYIL